MVGFALAAVVGYHRFATTAAVPLPAPVAVNWPAALDASEAAALLADLGLTDSAAAMSVFLRATAAPACIRPGPHLLPAGSTPPELVAALCRSAARPTVRLTIPEGFHRFAIAERLESLGVTAREAFLTATADPSLLYRLGVEPATNPVADTAEGYLFPATYRLPIDSAPAHVTALLIGEAKRRWAQLIAKHPQAWARLHDELGLGRRGVLTLASMVEKEAAVPDERPLIASVFLNRLRDPSMPRLQSDPTAMYGCLTVGEPLPACERAGGKPSPEVNRDRDNAYSTYTHDGLPPGPIANPGAASIEAVLAPAPSHYLYFVAKGHGRHHFSEEYVQHTEAIRRLHATEPR